MLKELPKNVFFYIYKHNYLKKLTMSYSILFLFDLITFIFYSSLQIHLIDFLIKTIRLVLHVYTLIFIYILILQLKTLLGF